jgi:hypothetical protein
MSGQVRAHVGDGRVGMWSTPTNLEARRMRRPRIVAALLVFALIPVLAAGCSSETRDKAKDAAESAKDDASSSAKSAGHDAKAAADKAKARAQAEGLRAELKADKQGDRDGLRSIDVINENVKDLPGDPDATGITDSDSDGEDDDGKVQFDVGDASACVTIPATGEDVGVTSGAC